MSITPPDPIAEVRDIVLLVFVILLVALFGWLMWDNSSLRTQVNEQKTEISDYKTANVDLTNQAQQCNAAVNQLKTDADARTKAADIAIAASSKQAATFTQNASAIYQLVPQGTDDCVAAKKIGDQYFARKP